MPDDKISFRQLLSPDDPQFARVTQCQYDWWGAEFGLQKDQVALFMAHMLGRHVPYTYVMEQGDTLLGFYQVRREDLFTRPDLGPWFCNAFILPERRGRGYFRLMNAAALDHARQHGLAQIYLHTRHQGLYEKFGWQKLESSDKYKPDGIKRTIYVRQLA